MIRYLYVRRHAGWRDILTRASRATDAGHVGVQIGPQEIVDLSLSHDCAVWTPEEWASLWVPVRHDDVQSVSEDAEAQAKAEARACVGRLEYDLPEFVGFGFWRQMGSPDRGICSGFAQRIFHIQTGAQWPDSRGRIDPRHIMIATSTWAAARPVNQTPWT